MSTTIEEIKDECGCEISITGFGTSVKRAEITNGDRIRIQIAASNVYGDLVIVQLNRYEWEGMKNAIDSYLEGYPV